MATEKKVRLAEYIQAVIQRICNCTRDLMLLSILFLQLFSAFLLFVIFFFVIFFSITF